MLEKQKRLNFISEMQSKVILTATNLAGLSIKHGVLGGYILKKQRNALKFVQKTVQAAYVVVEPPSELMRTI